ncbi:PAS/PAC sensor hybrid histidine kinase [Methylobacterium sp. 4-46]|uniref:response regulator n=1 Tax=unclassified Methylobacterium TaxID=2615210 RepID=UPI000152CF02|nr:MULTISPECIES: response regulator [Methylobacterium]ACA14818.1 PAS/PAC sensor hybrid histidine kinase [Methylobacterium sp. 4-46]WFT80563.1 response regulator [Methylobacterium nodulans]
MITDETNLRRGMDREAARGTILAVDDEPDILVALEDLLEDEFRVLTASRPADALALLAAEPDVAVIVSDQRMPGMTGDALLARAREVSDAQAILLTGYADLSAVTSALNRGGITGYVTKPWDAALLRGAVRAAYERCRLGRDLATERALLRGLLDHAGDAIAFKDPQGRFVRLNAAKAARLGAAVEDCLGEPESRFLDPETAARVEAADREAAAGLHPVEATIAGGPAAAPTWTQVVRVPIRDAHGALAHLATIERDVTEQKQLEARLRQADKMQALGTLAGGVAHDFNNLLTAIMGSLELALPKVAGDARLTRLMTNAAQAAQRGAALTKRLLSFSRQRDLQARVVDLNGVIRGMDDLLGRSLGGFVQVDHALAPDLWPARVDPEQLELAILNLCINGRDAMPDGGIVTLSTRNVVVAGSPDPDLPDGDYAVIAIADTGTGIPPEILSRVFEPFFTTKAQGQGTGLGLAMVFSLLQQSGGTIRIDTEVGRGTRVDLYLPRAHEPVETDEARAGAAVPPRRRARILVVDDDPQVRHVTASFLSGFGHEAVEVPEAEAALARIEAEPFDLVVADLAMPGMTGLDLAEAVRGRRPDLPFLIVTGHAEAARIPHAYAVLEKPFPSGELGTRVAALLADAPERR